MRFVRNFEQTVHYFLSSINRFAFIKEEEMVYCEVRTEPLYKIDFSSKS
jgi:hypothetical protein